MTKREQIVLHLKTQVELKYKNSLNQIFSDWLPFNPENLELLRDIQKNEVKSLYIDEKQNRLCLKKNLYN